MGVFMLSRVAAVTRIYRTDQQFPKNQDILTHKGNLKVGAISTETSFQVDFPANQYH